MNKISKRILSLVLCFVMLVGYMPVNALATEGEGMQPTVETVAVESSETTEATQPEEESSQPEETEEESSEPGETEAETSEPEETEEETTQPEETEEESSEPGESEEETEPEETENEAEQEDDGVLQILMGSDYAGDMSAVMAQIQAAYSDIDEMYFLGNYSDAEALLAEAQGYYALDTDVTLVQGAEDGMNDLLTWSGFHDTNDYAAFVINEEEYVNGVADILSILDSYLCDRVASGFDQPIFVLSNRGLHYGSGNTDARDVFEKLNAAAAEGLTIIYVYGDAEDAYLGEGAVCLQVGDTISVAAAETYAEETLNFTYLNAGAVSDNMTVFTIGEETVSVSRYDAQGLCQLKNEGIGDELMAANTAVYESPLSVKITAPAEAVVDAPYGDFEAEADPNAIYVLAGGDFQAGDNGKEDHYYSRINMGNILDQIKEHYSRMDGFIFVGDYDGDSHNDSNANAGVEAMMEEVSERFNTLNHDNSYLIEGNHETGAVSGIDATGGYDRDGYAVYLINETDFCERQEGKSTQIQNVANNLKTWLNNKIGEGYEAPIFVVTHTPLGYTTRTYTNGDSLYGKYVFDVLNDAGKNGLNIIFLHGHDHAYGADNYLGGEAIYLPVGDKINICVPGDKTSWTEETLNFTYMNAGYVGYYNENYYDVKSYEAEKLTMTVFKIVDNQVTVERYSKDGLYNLKSEGREGFYSNASTCSAIGLSYNTDTYASPQTITLQESNADEMGTTGNWVGVETEPEDDVTTSGNNWTTITEAEAGGIKYVLDTDGVNANTKYLIVNTGSNGDAYVLTNNNGNVERTPVTISNGEIIVDNDTNINWTFNGSTSGTVGNQGRYVYPNNGSLSLQTSGSNLTISNEDNGEYLLYRTDNSYRRYYVRYNNGWTGTRVNSYYTTTYSIYLFAFKENVTGAAGLYGRLDGKLSYPVAAGTSAADALAAVKEGITVKYATQADYSDEATYEDDGQGMSWDLDRNYNPNVPGDYAVTISYNGTVLGTAEVIVPNTITYYIAEGNGLYLVDMNTTEANALAAVKAGITIYKADNASGSNKTAISDDEVTWKWVDTYNGADSGPYTVEILKNGTSLGTVEVKVNIQYETGIESDWTYIGETEATGGSYTYTLDTDGIDYGEENKYIIVDDNEAIALHANSSSNGTAQRITISGNTATTTTRDYEYHMIRTTYNGTRYELITKGDGSQYLYQESNGVRYGTRSSVKFQVNHHGNGVYDIHDIDGTNWYIIYNGGWTVTETTSARVRLYKYTGTTGGTPGGPIYAKIEGSTVYTVAQGSSATKALAAVKAGITGYISGNADGSNATELEDSQLTWKWKNTFNGNSIGSYWVEISYQGKVLGTVEVKVLPGVVNNYPEYPDEGAVKVNKTGTGIDFQSSGIAQVEVSASGVPLKKGADVIVMLDTSSSMTSHNVTGTSQTRAQVLEESLKNLIAQFKTPGDDGQLLDLRVAIADFNGFYGENHNSSGTPYDRDAADMMSDDISYNANSEAQVYTGDRTLGAGAFIPVEDLAASYTLNYTSGTNYDYAMDAIYQLGTNIKASNTEERDLYVIFMSDGAAMQWNYYHSQGASSLWNNWITGAWTANQLSLNCTTHAYYYDEVDHNGDGMRNEHRMANAIKGDPMETYEVIRKVDTLGTPTEEENMYMVPGLGATMFAISFDAQADTNVTEESMDKSIESLASPQTGTTQYYYKVTTANELKDAFTAIGSEIAYAAYNARFVDQMGDDYDLQLLPYKYLPTGETNWNNAEAIAPEIEIISYDIYTRQDYLNGTITEDKIGDRKGTSTTLETITTAMVATQNADGNYTGNYNKDENGNYVKAENGQYRLEVYSDQINGGKTNILADGTDPKYVKGVIYAKTFLYNTNILDAVVNGVSIPTGKNSANLTTGSTNVLPSETFYWKMGTVQTSELAMRYYVYLTGSMEGTREGGSYPTNEFATLYYDNYLNNPCYKETVSPVMAWKEANVSYAFYLVDENGNIIVNQTTGQTGSFANKIAVTNPVVYETVLLNNDEEVSSIDIASLNVLPEGYELFDVRENADGTKTGATYTVTIKSNTTGNWAITSVKDAATTYVMQYDPEDAAAYSNERNHNTVGNDYTHTVVWFAVLWKVQALPDAVVVDYGLPVDISVLTNDMFGENGKLAGVGEFTEDLNLDGHTASLASDFTTSYTGTYGDAKADLTTGKVRYTLKTMEMNGYEKFAYAANYTGNENAGYYYDTVTVIPATTIYYEDSFLKYSATNTEWVDEGTKIEGATQDEDRPGQFSLTDANNIYGFDSVNNNMSEFSLGTAKKVHVDADSFATASFSFYGTGFDVIGMTSNTTGAIAVSVKDATGAAVANKFVNTYYGYNYDGTNWIATPDEENALYQVPVLQIEQLPYGHYTVTITATYAGPLDKTSADGYDLYLDAIRIYDPANDGASDGGYDTTIEDAYEDDGESWPSYIELRNKIIAANSFDDVANDALTKDMEGLVFIDGDDKVDDNQISDYVSYGPNNEIYLAPGQRVAFLLSDVKGADGKSIVKSVHIGIKSADGSAGTYTITNIAQNTNSETGVNAGDYYSAKTDTINTTTDMYYDITGYKGDIIVISNTGDRYNTEGVISLTNIKSTYTINPNGTSMANEGIMPLSLEEEESVSNEVAVYMTPAAATLTLRSLNRAEPVESTPVDNIPEETVPETTVPEETEPEETEPETTVPEETEPEETVPETTVPEETEPEDPAEQIKEIVQTVVKTVVNVLKNLFGGWFR